MVVTTNAATLPTPDPTALQTIDSLLNNTGPPNVALQVINTLYFRMYFIIIYYVCFSVPQVYLIHNLN